MPTQEERFTALEKSVAALQEKTATSIIELDENTTILLGVIRRQGQDIRRTSEHLHTIDQRLERLETKVDEHTRLLHDHTSLLTQILERLPKTS